MGSNEQILTNSGLISQEIHLIGPPERLARVCCRARKMPQQPCDGTCGECKKNFNNYFEETLKLMKSSFGEPTGFGPDEEEPIPTEEACREILKKRIADWVEEKRQIIHAREQDAETRRAQALELQVDERMRTLEILALMPVDMVDNAGAIQH